ncbi:MAG: iron ABC transporter permease [Acidobacteriota bacterium]|nr:iron ABC transporter permease [Acidobacteriota bacterium]
MPLETKPETEFGAPRPGLAQRGGSFAGVRAFRPVTPRRLVLICAMLLAVLFVAVVIALRMGTFPISIREIVLTLFNGAIGRRAEIPSDYWLVVFGLRLPRIALGILVGAALSTAGAGYQALLRNPLADPYVLGVSSGAAVGAIVSLILVPRLPGAIQIAAFVGAVATIAVVYLLGRRGGQLDSATLLLAGIVTASFLSAVIMFLMTTLSGRDLRGMSFWLMGDLATPPSVNMGWLYFLLVIGLATIYGTAADLNLILTGEQEARHLGVNVNRVKLVVYLAASVLTGLAVSVSGAIGFLGLLVPHVMRMLFGTDYRVLIPASAIGGAILIVLADTLARTVVAPTELPVGAMTAIAGAPLFIYLMRRRVR